MEHTTLLVIAIVFVGKAWLILICNSTFQTLKKLLISTAGFLPCFCYFENFYFQALSIERERESITRKI